MELRNHLTATQFSDRKFEKFLPLGSHSRSRIWLQLVVVGRRWWWSATPTTSTSFPLSFFWLTNSNGRGCSSASHSLSVDTHEVSLSLTLVSLIQDRMGLWRMVVLRYLGEEVECLAELVYGSGEGCGWPNWVACDHGVRGAVWLCRKWSWPWVMLWSCEGIADFSLLLQLAT